MKFIYFLLPLVSSALADSLIKCPCNQQDCSTAADTCACENQNIVNKYYCCDANTAPAQNLSLQDCKEGKLSANKVHIPLEFLRGLCGGPHDLSCSDPHDICTWFPGYPIDHPLTWGLCLPFGYPGIPFSNRSRNSIDSATSTVFETSTVSASSNKSSSSSAVPVSTSTISVTSTVGASSNKSSSSSAVPVSTSTISVTSVVGASSNNSSSSPSVPVSTLTVVETTTPTSAVRPSTLVTVEVATAVATTTTFTTSTKSSPSATATTTTTTSTTSTTSKPSATATTITTVTTSTIRPRSAAAIACGGAKDADCPEGYYCDNGGKCPGTMTAFMGWDCSGI